MKGALSKVGVELEGDAAKVYANIGAKADPFAPTRTKSRSSCHGY
jgi:hypothetical protein